MSKLRTRILQVVACAATLMSLTAGIAVAVPGAVDPSYGQGGAAPVFAPTKYSFGVASTVAPDGTIVMAGASSSIPIKPDAFSLDFRVHPIITRTRADGSRVAGWGTDGLAPFYLQHHFSFATGLDALADGSVLVTGASIGLLEATAFVAKLDPTGKLDPSFGGGDGYITVLPEDMNALMPIAVHQQPGGQVLVVADSFSGDLASIYSEGKRKRTADFDIVLMRYTAAGLLDRSFASNGFLRFESSGTNSLDGATAAHFDANGNVTIAGASVNDSITLARTLLARFSPDGVLDRSFGTNGLVRSAARRARWEAVTALEVRGDGAITTVVARLDEGSEADDYEADEATLLTRHDSAGVVLRTTELPIMLGTSVTTLTSGATLIGGSNDQAGACCSDSYATVIAKVRADGKLDTTFDQGGVTEIGITSGGVFDSAIAGMHPQANGSVLIAGTLNGQLRTKRVFNDDPAGAGRRAAKVRLSVTPRGAVGCGRTAKTACRVSRARIGEVTLHIATSGVAAGTAMTISDDGYEDYSEYDGYDPDDGYWDSNGLTRVTAGTLGGAKHDISAIKFDGDEELHRYRVDVAASAAARSTHTTIYVRAVGPLVLTRRARQDRDESVCDTDGVSAFAANVRLACSQVRRERRANGDWHDKVRRFLGR